MHKCTANNDQFTSYVDELCHKSMDTRTYQAERERAKLREFKNDK